MKAYLIGGEYDLTVLNVNDDRRFIHLHSIPEEPVIMGTCSIETEAYAKILTYRIFARTEDDRLMYEFVKGDV